MSWVGGYNRETSLGHDFRSGLCLFGERNALSRPRRERLDLAG
jgi:hypothetical protein